MNGIQQQLAARGQITEEDYQPNRHNLNLWLGTRKAPSNWFLPGLLGTYGHDGWWFFLAVFAEVWGLWNFWAATRFSPYFLGLLFLLDIIGAMLAHTCAEKECIQRNLRQVYLPTPGTAIDLHIMSLVPFKRKVLRFFGWVMILGVAAIKIWGVLNYKVMFLGPVLLSIIAAYIIAVYVHLGCTGHFLWEIWRWLMWTRERVGFREALAGGAAAGRVPPGWPQVSRLPIVSGTPLVTGNFGKRGNKHVLSGGEPDGEYVLETFGLLDDEAVSEMCRNQSRDGKELLRKKCISMQLDVFLGLDYERKIAELEAAARRGDGLAAGGAPPGGARVP